MRKSENKFERNTNNSQGDLVCGRLNCLERSGVNPLVRRVMKTCFGSKPLSLAVRKIINMINGKQESSVMIKPSLIVRETA